MSSDPDSGSYISSISEVERKWTDALETHYSVREPGSAKGVHDVYKATAVFESQMDPNLSTEPSERSVRGSLKRLLRKNLGGWAENWILITYKERALEKLIPLLHHLETKYQEYDMALSNIPLGSAKEPAHLSTPVSEKEDWVIPSFENVISSIHTQLEMSVKLTHLFDEQQRLFYDVDQPPSRELSTSFMATFSAALAIQMPVSFDEVAYMYFEAIFHQYETVALPTWDSGREPSKPDHPFSPLSTPYSLKRKRQPTSDHRGLVDLQIDPRSQELQSQQEQQDLLQQEQVTRKQRQALQDGRHAMDFFVDDKDEDLVEQLFHRHPHSHHQASHPTELILGSSDSPDAQERVDHYLDLCHQLEEIGLAAHLTDVIMRVLYSRIERKILGTFKQQWTAATLDEGKDWMVNIILPFLRMSLLSKGDRGDRGDPRGRTRYKLLASRLEFYFFKTFGDLRIQEFFDIIVECPESNPAVLDLKKCVEWTGQRDQLLNSILSSMEKRLLHPGAETVDIIDFYISAIRYLRILDPSGLMLEKTAQAINKYLRTRDDTMRAIVSCIVDDSSDLFSAEGLPANAAEDDDEEEAAVDDDEWVPVPANAGPDLSSARRRMADIISVLVNIYDTNDRFIEEFKSNFADRLLQAVDFNVDREVRQLELLKLRFGETDLHHCDVMLADIAESKRTNTNIQSMHPELSVDSTIASRYYWPELEKEPVDLPGPFKEMLSSYGEAFQNFKPAQRLEFFPTMGLVDIELEMADHRVIERQVNPIVAAIIYLFQDQPHWSLTDLAVELHLPEETVEQKVQYWILEGVLRETSRFQYRLVEDDEAAPPTTASSSSSSIPTSS
ncbi:Anaphase-promoting complex subunit 2 [Lunasporangiospora selenospora]|uniref:Anaphase-promoting complex subunit 2 n=1 Tax=Lunasporangiospora selenospora TaxID=979761 RepID=A0A9P6KEC3_9FUNG|nr:Anaphase-promoting complex subunit 2 [Lunasporangiospora selenospora]